MLIIVIAFRLLNYTQTAFKSVHTQTIIQDRNYKKKNYLHFSSQRSRKYVIMGLEEIDVDMD